MTKQRVKYWLLGTAFIALMMGGGVYAAEDDHGHGHVHEEAEESHDKAGRESHGHAHDDEHTHGDEEGSIHLTQAQIEAAGIVLAPAAPGALTKEISVPGRIVPAADRMAQIVPRVSGTVHAIKKNLGDMVEKDEILAEIESREMADAVAEYRAASKAVELANSTFKREKTLWERKITAEQDYLSARNAQAEAVIAADLARAKLRTLGYDEKADKGALSRFHALRAPISGRVIARDILPGAFADTGKAAFTIADLSHVWVDIAVPPSDLPFAAEGQSVRITSSHGNTEGTVIFLSPAIDPETGAAKAIVEIDNDDGTWRPGLFVTAAIGTGTQDAALMVPKTALQTIEGKPSVFVRTDDGFEKREITTGRDDGKNVEILSGIARGEIIATSNTFTLKAELGKSEAEHAH